MGGGGNVRIVFEELVEVGESPFVIGILFFWAVDETLPIDVFDISGVGEESFEVGVCEWVVVG